MARIACLLMPLFPLAARLRSEPELAGQAVAICDGNGSAARVVAASRSARQAGVRAGMTLAQARSVMPDIIARGRDSGCERSAHEALLEVAWSLSPRVEDAGEDVVYADVSGMEQLFPEPSGEERMGHSAIVTARAMNLPLRLGIAANKLAARVAAQMPNPPTVVPAGEEASFLSPLPLSRLDLGRRMAETLSQWGITTIGELAHLPADEVASRLGLAGARAQQAAQGIDSHPLVPYQPPPTLSEGMELEWPVVTVEPLLFALRQSLERIHERLEQQDLACSLLELELGLEPEGVDRRDLHMPAPIRDVESLLALIRLEVESHPPGAPVAAFTCVVHPNQARRGQLTLFGPVELHPDKLATTIARLTARLGPDRVGSPRLVDGHRPERFVTTTFDPPPPPRVRRPPRSGRGLLVVRVLRPPVELEVITEDDPRQMEEQRFPRPCPKGPAEDEPAPINGYQPPQRLHLVSVASAVGATPRIQGLVRVAAGPWRMQSEWWSEQPAERDYWDVELSSGGLYRIYHDNTSKDWFADGVYD
jgi:protein ImuB